MKRWLPIAKWLWIILIAVGIIWYFRNNYASIRVNLQTISFMRLVSSSVLIFIGRALMVEIARESVAVVGTDVSYPTQFKMVYLSELGKYLPGGIWHFVGRAGYYRNAGLSIQAAGRAMFLEILWLIISSAILGCIALLIYSDYAYAAILSIGLILTWAAFAAFFLRRKDETITVPRLARLLLIQLAVWFCFGLSYWVLLPIAFNGLDFSLTVGAFAISWLVGLLTVLAPGGIGTREATITTLMLPMFPANTTIVFASIHRLLWIGIEILMGLIAILLESRDSIQTTVE